MEATSDPSKILERGPEYLRKQMELESETKVGLSAVERLAMSKPKYVKSQQVINTTQEIVITVGSIGSNGSSTHSSNRGLKLLSNIPPVTISSDLSTSVSPGQVRRSSSKKRPDSVLLYRQKCDLLRASASNNRRHPISRRLLHKLTVQEDTECGSKGFQERIPKPGGKADQCTLTNQEQNGVSAKDNKENTSLLIVPKEDFRGSGKGVSRSHSDISSRYSKSFADFDGFFKYCGLDCDIIESLGKENFSAHSDEIALNIRSVSVSNSDDGFSKSSGDSDGLQADEVLEKIRQGTSVIERNARIIKWLYSCKNATETGKKLRDLE